MRAIIQRVSRASVTVDDETIGQIESGMLILVGVEEEDGMNDVQYLAEKCANLRIFQDEDGKMNLCLRESGGAMLVVSQFTLLGDCRKGRRPSFVKAADPSTGKRLYEAFVDAVKQLGVKTETGRFQADMKVELLNDGPVTLLVDSRKVF